MDTNYVNQEETVQVAGFIRKTFEILNDDQYSRIIYWSPTGNEFIIKDINKFQQVVLPKSFRHNKINSFIRQLNMYGFHKSRKQHSKSVFSHPKFLKGREDLLKQIKRKIKQTQEQQIQKCSTPSKLLRNVKQQMDTNNTGRSLSQPHQLTLVSLKHLNPMQSFGSSFKQLFQSKQNLSKQYLNFSLGKISQNCIGEIPSIQENPQDDVISIQNGIEGNKEREKEELNLPSIAFFQNPSCFFNSFISK